MLPMGSSLDNLTYIHFLCLHGHGTCMALVCGVTGVSLVKYMSES